jgi:hypothetical protein
MSINSTIAKTTSASTWEAPFSNLTTSTLDIFISVIITALEHYRCFYGCHPYHVTHIPFSSSLEKQDQIALLKWDIMTNLTKDERRYPPTPPSQTLTSPTLTQHSVKGCFAGARETIEPH